MKEINFILIALLGFVLVFGACDSEDDLIEDRIEENPLPTDPGPLTGSAGEADFDIYISLGNSLTAGLMDGALYTRGQQSSFPNLLAGRFALAGGGDFNQPDINSANGLNVNLNDLENAFDPAAANFGRFFLDLSISAPSPTTSADPLNMVDNPSSINNLGIPGMRLIEIATNGYGTLNPFYTRFATNVASTSVLEQALARQPTFMTFWLGNNDALVWATGGGMGPTGIDDTGMPDPSMDATPNALVSTTSFNAAIDGAMAAFFTSFPNLKGVILNIPNVTTIPFFQAVRWNSVVMDEATATNTSAAFSGFNNFLNLIASPAGGSVIPSEEAAYRQISFEPESVTDDPATATVEGNGVVIEDDQVTDLTDIINGAFQMGSISEGERDALLPLAKARQMKSAQDDPDLIQLGLPGELITLSAGTELGTLADPNNENSVIGVGVPLGDEFTLTTDEIGLLLGRITAFNTKIASVADTYEGLVLFDANAFFTSIALNRGIEAGGFNYSPDFSPNGVFSTDGIHPNPVGHAILANNIMELIESSFGSELPAYDVTEFTTVLNQ